MTAPPLEELLLAMHNSHGVADLAASEAPSKEEEDDSAAAIDADQLSYEIFSILESKFLFGYDEPKLCPPPSSAAFNAVNAVSIKSQRGKVCILSVDGAGMRGVISGKILSCLEQSLRAKSGDPNATISDYFDIAAGTGVGGLFAAMLFSSSSDGRRPLFRADDTWRFLADHGRRLFPHRRRRRFFSSCVTGGDESADADAVFRSAFGEALTLKDAVKPLLVPCYDLLTAAPLVFSRADAVESDGYDFNMWEIVRATCAEPGRFAPRMIASADGTRTCVGIDGGAAAMGNPTAAAITHVLHNKHEFPFVRGVEDLLVLSIGVPAAAAVKGNGKTRRWSEESARPTMRIAAEGAAELVDHAVAMAFGNSRCSNYVRIQADNSSLGKSGPDADYDPSPGNVKILLSAAEDMLKQKNVESVMFGGKRIGENTNMEKLDWFAGELVLEQQRRSCRIAPTVAFKQPPPKPK